MKIYGFKKEILIKVCKLINKIVSNTAYQNRKFKLCISGGKSIEILLVELCKYDLSWERINVFIADERCEKVGSIHRNDKQIYEILASKLPLHNFKKIEAELGPSRAARKYSSNLATVSKFDLSILSVGTDGHIASIFNNYSKKISYSAAMKVLPIYNSPKFPKKRVSISLSFLKRSNIKILLLFGKKELYKTKNKIIASKINPTHWFISTK
jgi:6-phosphogluconolactonase